MDMHEMSVHPSIARVGRKSCCSEPLPTDQKPTRRPAEPKYLAGTAVSCELLFTAMPQSVRPDFNCHPKSCILGKPNKTPTLPELAVSCQRRPCHLGRSTTAGRWLLLKAMYRPPSGEPACRRKAQHAMDGTVTYRGGSAFSHILPR